MRTLNWEEYLQKARQTSAEGCVLLKNENRILPYKKDTRISVFGRIQLHYYKSGTGSGGMVNVSKVTGILDALDEASEVTVNRKLVNIYLDWEKEHPFDEGIGWSNEPWCQEEMPLSDEVVKEAAASSDTALVIIGRTAGEDKDNSNEAGSYQLTVLEKEMLQTVRRYFKSVTVVLNTGNIIDMKFVEDYKIDAVLYAWQGGMIGGYGVADILTGRQCPSGRLSDTIAFDIADYPSTAHFGDPLENIYEEDIYVGYRYFETAAKDKVVYPFGFGLSYTTFSIEYGAMQKDGMQISLPVIVENTGSFAGKEVVQLYIGAPQGKLGKPSRQLAAFAKTIELEPTQKQELVLTFSLEDFASYDDNGVSGHKSAYVLEPGTYHIYGGINVRDAKEISTVLIKECIVTKQLTECMAPFQHADRIKAVENADGTISFVKEAIPERTISPMDKRMASLPESISCTGDKGYRLQDVQEKKVSMMDFLAQLTDEELSCMVHGEGMNSPKVTPGTAAAYGGVTKRLQEYGIPCACCTDGPSGMRFDCGTKAFSLPNGTLFACTFNVELIEELFELVGMEMAYHKIDALLGPGINIHRNPLNGRNFEYFSEDPMLTGKMAAAQLRGMHKSNVTGTIKHFCGNNQELGRSTSNSIISERALREIYLKGYEIAVKEGNADSVMTSYGAVNGIWCAGNYDLNTSILRKEWGFNGIVMTDWWAKMNDEGQEAVHENFAAMIRAQNDVYMVCANCEIGKHKDNVMEALENGTLTRGELMRNAANICSYLLTTNAYKHLLHSAPEIEIINREEDTVELDTSSVVFKTIEDTLVIPLADQASGKGDSFIIALDTEDFGEYEFSVTGKSSLGELAQIPMTLFYGTIPNYVITFSGTNNQWMEKTITINLYQRFTILRVEFMQNGLDLKEVKIRRKQN